MPRWAILLALVYVASSSAHLPHGRSLWLPHNTLSRRPSVAAIKRLRGGVNPAEKEAQIREAVRAAVADRMAAAKHAAKDGDHYDYSNHHSYIILHIAQASNGMFK